MVGLAVGQMGDFGGGWLSAPFGDGGIDTEAAVFWGDECCPDCSACPTCQG